MEHVKKVSCHIAMRDYDKSDKINKTQHNKAQLNYVHILWDILAVVWAPSQYKDRFSGIGFPL